MSPNINAKRNSNYNSKSPQDVYQVPATIKVDKGETVVIKLDCKNGFTVLIPYKEIFGKHEFHATNHNSWAVGAGAPKHEWWGVSMVRSNEDNPSKVVKKGKKKEVAYCIYSKDLDNFAVGNSPPKMILDP